MPTITRLETHDVRFPTSRELDGSDAMHTHPDYSAAYVILRTDTAWEGHGLTFTIGHGNEVVIAAIQALAPLVVGSTLEEISLDMGAFWRRLAGDSQLRWIGPEKGAIHLATAAVVNAVWDLWAKVQGKPLWRLLADMTPEQLVRCIDFRYLSDVLTPDEAIALLERQAPTRAERIATLLEEGYPAYTTSAGWLGYDDAKILRLCQAALADGWTHFKLKVGANLADDLRRARLMRDLIGPHNVLMMDANQTWDVPEAISWVRELAQVNPWWIEEPTSPDDVLGHAAIAQAIAPIKVATGEMVQNRVLFKQLFQARAIGVCQIDACRVGGVNEVLAVLLMAAKYDVPVCPHAGGVGLCEYVQHLAMFDYVAVSGSMKGRVIEFVDHLHEHFVDPVVIRRGRYVPPSAPGYSITMKPDSIATFTFPTGPSWRESMPSTRHSLQRYGQVIGLKPDQIETYERLHAQVWPEVLAMIQACNMRNYSIFRRGTQLFAYFEYVGEDFAADMNKMAADPKTEAWWKLTDPLQEPLPDRAAGEWWATMREVFHTN
ncbi:MAG TPA: enolase C-terminal domain-like protein [Ktedonobacterales bacterium]